jgi:hypothetical protein
MFDLMAPSHLTLGRAVRRQVGREATRAGVASNVIDEAAQSLATARMT